jgi:hypothetical protein
MPPGRHQPPINRGAHTALSAADHRRYACRSTRFVKTETVY